ncbi:hypothetical protein JZ751_013762 [Albula glossodonta]|uniref:Uncharacterized protein n=1 Tax=Albula glossodonta TaxID=121402 RepID=A0A8T2P1S4_9TELE|nr:hypothetical protein JZ751_013762 [Albula glossodonta]
MTSYWSCMSLRLLSWSPPLVSRNCLISSSTVSAPSGDWHLSTAWEASRYTPASHQWFTCHGVTGTRHRYDSAVPTANPNPQGHEQALVIRKPRSSE